MAPAKSDIETNKTPKSTKKHSLWRWFMNHPDGDALELRPLKDKDQDAKIVPEVALLYSKEDPEGIAPKEVVLTSSTQKKFRLSLVLTKDYLVEYFFPPTCPNEVQLLRLDNLAIPACYLLVGTMQGIFRPLLNVYPLDLGATEAQQTILASIATLPAAFKLIYGFLSDNVPIYGYRRKPYMIGGWFTCILLMAALVLSSDLSLTYDTNGQAIPPVHAPSMEWLGACFFIFGTGMWVADVMADSMVAQKARLEPEAIRGSLQSSCYACRFFGMMVSSPISTYLYSHYGPGLVIRILLWAPLLVMPLIYYLAEDHHIPIQPTAHQVEEIWKTVCSRSVWQPMGFIYIFNLLQIPNSAWKQFLKTVLAFTDAELNLLLVASYALLYAGTMTYKFFFLHSSWRRLYQVCILLNALVSSMQLLLIRGQTLGLSPFLFSLGDEAFAEFLSGMQFLPCAILMVTLCPPGSEGASYAMFTTVWNSAMMLAPPISTMLLPIWDVSKDALEAGQLDGLFNLAILTTMIQISPIFLIGWLPHRREDLLALSEKQFAHSSIGGANFLTILFGSMLYTFVITILNIIHPGWAGES